VEELIENRTTYEMELKYKEERESGVSKKKLVALIGTTTSEEEEDEAETKLA